MIKHKGTYHPSGERFYRIQIEELSNPYRNSLPGVRQRNLRWEQLLFFGLRPHAAHNNLNLFRSLDNSVTLDQFLFKRWFLNLSNWSGALSAHTWRYLPVWGATGQTMPEIEFLLRRWQAGGEPGNVPWNSKALDKCSSSGCQPLHSATTTPRHDSRDTTSKEMPGK